MNTQKMNSFSIIGISVKTTNENGKSSIDIPALWNTFMTDKTLDKIPNKIDDTVYCIYTEYEKDYTAPYTTILGCKVSSLANVPTGMIAKTINEGNYIKYTAKGNILQGIVFEKWVKIWNTTLPRAYAADVEVYGIKAQNTENAEVDIFVSVI